MSDLGAFLRAKRNKRGHSLRKAAEVSGVSASTLSRIERDAGVSDTDTLRKLAVYCEVSLASLVVMEDVPEASDEETEAYLVAYGYHLEELRQEINALIDEVSDAAKAIVLRGAQV